MELVLSRHSGDHGSRLGFWNGVPIDCGLFNTGLMEAKDLVEFKELGEEEAREICATANKSLSWFHEVGCGYAGWLMTNSEFCGELADLRSNLREPMHRWGTAMVGVPIPSGQSAGASDPSMEEGWAEYDSSVLEFCVKWRLQGIAGPDVPVPMLPMMCGQFPLSIVTQLMRAGGLFNWPDTFPVPARDELRDLLVASLQAVSPGEHLEGWQRIIDASNKAKNQIGSFERRFRLIHFWRVLRERHPGAFKRRVNLAERAFAEYLGVDESTVHSDRQTIAKALGKDWDLPSSAEQNGTRSA
ncbi:hypothetical protein Pan216_25670 [Planctomycetes bacterium Pan216]|uniref:Uncharacterized protein n=1 Tax=Kolteria novifilia TaxID=2527975 RepID=A0A518B3Z8_9BACT|nr:hypothetical protein Pan216_25670 [Planctomycetes bacterium Pan216]